MPRTTGPAVTVPAYATLVERTYQLGTSALSSPERGSLLSRHLIERLNANYLPTDAAGRAGPPFDRPSLILTGRQDSTVGYRGA